LTPKEKEAGAPGEIEITPAMMEAGADELYQDDWVETKEEWAARIFRAMIAVSRRKKVGAS
jgi:hypothetical protein